MHRFALWAAVSSEKQRDNASLEEQEEHGRKVGAAKGWEETGGPYIVPGESRTRWVNLIHAERKIPALAQMLEDARGGAFDVLLLYDYNRLRDLLDPVAKTLAAYGVQIYSVSQPVEPLEVADFNPYASDSESMMRGMSQIISRWQISDLKRKFRYGVTSRVRKGLHSIRLPFGYQSPNGDKSQPGEQVPQLIRYVVAMKDMLLAGERYVTIARFLTDNEAPTINGGKWEKTIIKQILTNPYYAGKVFFGRYKSVNDPHRGTSRIAKNETPLLADGQHKAVFTWEEHEAILLEVKRRENLGRRNQYKFSGLLVCSVCSKRLIRDTTYREPVYHCPGKYHTLITEAEAVALIPHKIQSLLLYIDSDALPSVPVEEVDLSELERQRAKIQSGYERGIYSDDEAERKIKAVDAQMQALKNGEAQTRQREIERREFRRAVKENEEVIYILPQWVREREPRKVNTLLARLCSKMVVSPDGEITVDFPV